MRRPDNRWNVARVAEQEDREAIRTMARALSVPELVARVLWLRGRTSPAEARSFLAPRLADLAPPAALIDMDRASERIARAARTGERIGIYGDYDVDGMTGTALLVRFLRLAGADVVWAIPERDGDGYGLHPNAMNRLADRGVRLVVTVDNGTMAHAAVDRAVELGIDVVVTDHHLPGETLPNAFAIVNPHRRDATGAGVDLCGCAVAFKTAWAVADRLRQRATGNEARFRAFLRDAVGLVALATVSDVVALGGENRILVSAGLRALRTSDHPGVRALLTTARVGNMPLTTEDVAFRLAPRINAAGRLSRPDIVIDLLTATDATQAHRLARTLADANAERRKVEKAVLAEAEARADEVLADGAENAIVVHGEGWHQGVIGIVAARLVDRHHLPAVVIGFSGDGGRGSCRTVGGVNLHDALTRCGDHLSRYGGHAKAAGLEIERCDVETFTTAFEAAVRDQTGSTPPAVTIDIDAETEIDEWTLDTVQALVRLEPFGEGNPAPLFLIRGAQVAGRARLMGQNDAHLTFALKQSQGAIRVVAFRKAAHYELVASSPSLDLVVAPMLNEWRGTRTAELRLVDIREASVVGAAPQEAPAYPSGGGPLSK